MNLNVYRLHPFNFISNFLNHLAYITLRNDMSPIWMLLKKIISINFNFDKKRYSCSNIYLYIFFFFILLRLIVWHGFTDHVFLAWEKNLNNNEMYYYLFKECECFLFDIAR